jgi:arylsulfatase A-like enzyme
MQSHLRCLWWIWIVFALRVDAGSHRPPNFLFIVADDLGYGDLGAFGQKHIRTPHLDRLASSGIRLTRLYSGNAVCAPSRCVLLTGKHPGHAVIRDNREVQPEGQIGLPGGLNTLPRILQSRGYATGAFGKWGLGSPESSGAPLQQGFDRFFGYNCQRQAHNHYPTHLWDDDRRLPLRNPAFSAYQQLPKTADPEDPASYRSYSGSDYAPDRIHEQALRFIRDHRHRPFFCFVPTTIPHLALQVPDDSLQEYAGAFPEKPYRGDQSYLPHRTPHAAYAAMITRMDREIGRLIALINELGLQQDTVVVFTSDNGPLWDRMGGTDTGFFNSAAGLRGRKGSLYEGGVRVPGIVSWPGHIQPATESRRRIGFEDWLPTLLELAGGQDSIPKDLDGISFAPTLLGRRQAERRFLYREFPAYGGQQAVWKGRWKAVRQNLISKDKPVTVRTELYDLERDPNETRDVASEHPKQVAALERLLTQEHVPSTEFPFPVLDRLSTLDPQLSTSPPLTAPSSSAPPHPPARSGSLQTPDP